MIYCLILVRQQELAILLLIDLKVTELKHCVNDIKQPK